MRTPVAEASRAGATPRTDRCSGRMGVNERPMKFTTKSTARRAMTPGTAATAANEAEGSPACRSAAPRSS